MTWLIAAINFVSCNLLNYFILHLIQYINFNPDALKFFHIPVNLISRLSWHLISYSHTCKQTMSLNGFLAGSFAWHTQPFMNTLILIRLSLYKKLPFYQQTVQYWFFSWLGKSSLGLKFSSLQAQLITADHHVTLIIFTIPTKIKTLYANFQVYPPAFMCITPVYTSHIGMHVLMVQISL